MKMLSESEQLAIANNKLRQIEPLLGKIKGTINSLSREKQLSIGSAIYILEDIDSVITIIKD